MITQIKHQKKLKILLLDQGRQVLPFLQSYKQKGYDITLVCVSKISEGYFSILPNRKYIWPNYNLNPEEFKERLLNYVKANGPDVTIALGDKSAGILSDHFYQLSKFTNLTVPTKDVFIYGKDKGMLMSYCMDNNIPCPKTIFPELINISELNSYINFPVIVKPKTGVGAVGIYVFEKLEDLTARYESIKNDFGDLIIQEYINYDNVMQFQAEAFVDSNSKMKACVVISKPRFFPIRGGTSSANVTICNTEIEQTAKRLLEGIKWRGAADIDFIYDPKVNEFKVLEINPRVTAGIKIAFAAGVDFSDLHVKLALSEDIPLIENYTIGIYCRNLILDLLWFIFATNKMRRSTHPSFFRLVGKNILEQTLSFKDPFTFFGFVLGIIKKYSNIKKLARKFSFK